MNNRQRWELFLISLISLYFELLVIRWLSSEVRIFAYFKNIPLMACLFGLGVGMATAKSNRDFTKWFPFGIAILVALMCFAEPLHLVHVTFSDPLEYYLIGEAADKFRALNGVLDKFLAILPGLALLVAVFHLIAATFLSIGQRLGQLLEDPNPLMAYSINVGASLLGIALFSLVSYLGLKPYVWLILGVAMGLYFYRGKWQILAMVAALVVAVAMDPKGAIWSPYYRVDISDYMLPADGTVPAKLYGHGILVNHDGIESAVDNSKAFIAQLTPAQKNKALDYYDVLYECIGDKPRDTLILAAGTGNDVSAALRHGATYIDAVEIDPMILATGKKLHPEQPYANPAVVPVADDARAFLKRTKRKYDLVDFAYLDSHSAFSSMSSVRLDNYVHTVDSFREGRALLKPDGVMSVKFYPTRWWQIVRIYKTLSAGVNEVPIGVWSKNSSGLTFLVGPGVDREKIKAAGYKLFTREEAEKGMMLERANWDEIGVTTDDWPFLFLRERGLNIPYASGLLFCLLSGWMLLGKYGTLKPTRSGWSMMCLGAAFMLMETKSVAQMGLLLGSTWLVNSAIIAAILVMILLANTVVLKFKLKTQMLAPLYFILIACLIGSTFVPLSVFNSLDVISRGIAGSLFLCFPLFFASLIFAISYAEVDDPAVALGMNLLGCLVGGALEYLSMMTGISALNLSAAVIYMVAFLIRTKMAVQPSGLCTDQTGSTAIS